MELSGSLSIVTKELIILHSRKNDNAIHMIKYIEIFLLVLRCNKRCPYFILLKKLSIIRRIISFDFLSPLNGY